MTPRPPILALLAVALLPACGGDDKPAPKPAAGEKKPAAAKPVDPGSSGLDLSSLQARNPGPAAPAPGPDASKPDAPKPADPKAPAGRAAEGKPADGAAADAQPGDPKDAGGKPADGKPAVPPPLSPDEISDTEVLMTWSKEERDALNEMSPAEKEKEMRKRRLEIFKERGGKLDTTSGKMADKKPDAPGAERGPARPDSVKEKDLAPPDLRDILQDIASRDAEVRARGVESAKRYSDKTVAARYIAPLLQDPDPELRAIACSTLGALKQADSVEALEKLVQKGDKDQVRAQAIKALADIGGLVGRAALRRIAKDGSEPSDRADALGMLIKLRETLEVKDLLAAALDDLDAGVRQQAVIAIREFNLKSFEPNLFPRLQDASEQVIVETMRAFAALGTRSAVGPLIQILVKEDPEADDPENLQNVANLALETITGIKQGYDASHEAARKAAIDAWRVWWKQNKEKWK